MAVSDILAGIDDEIAQLQKARALLTGAILPVTWRKPGRPRKLVTEIAAAAARPGRSKKRNLSPEGRKRIAEAAKRRWAAQKKTSS